MHRVTLHHNRDNGTIRIVHEDFTYEDGFLLDAAVSYCNQAGYQIVTNRDLGINHEELFKKPTMLTERPVYRGFTKGELNAAFEMVKDKKDWKGPINALVTDSQLAVVEAAIIWFTGTHVRISAPRKDGMIRVKSIGYRMGPCN